MDPSRYWDHHYPHSPTHRSPVLPQPSLTTIALQGYEFQIPSPRTSKYEAGTQKTLVDATFGERHLPSSQDSSSSSVVFESVSSSAAAPVNYHDKLVAGLQMITQQLSTDDEEDGDETEYRHSHGHEDVVDEEEEEEEERRGYRREQQQERAESTNQFSVWEEYQPDYRMLNESYHTMKEGIYKDIYATMEKLHTLEVGFEDSKGQFHARIEQDYQQLSLELMEKRTRLAKQRMTFVEESERMVQDTSKYQNEKTSLNTLRRDQNSLFATMFSGRHQLTSESDGAYFIDRDPSHFRLVLNYLRDLRIPPTIIQDKTM
ncbi:BTB (POZ) domain-containing protein [Apophysomyces sp. BC1034]|nr:BTB (POZ) domain-containing protein [Apophysomyces sp. BC1015]KAG0182252.1 BTB (POZ) domain-containing protein [Apophysomyces sp. BC1021]KAG0191391.1 BTB (POZ) domain-containing protein [Apophysomyces sp. BC1034]